MEAEWTEGYIWTLLGTLCGGHHGAVYRLVAWVPLLCLFAYHCTPSYCSPPQWIGGWMAQVRLHVYFQEE